VSTLPVLRAAADAGPGPVHHLVDALRCAEVALGGGLARNVNSARDMWPHERDVVFGGSERFTDDLPSEPTTPRPSEDDPT